MSRLNAQQAETFPESSGRTSFLSLQNDKDEAIVRFAYNTVEEIKNSTDLVHDVMVEGRNRQVDCLRSDFSQPDSVCPLCASGLTPKKVLYFNVRNEQTGEMQVWQRSESYFKANMETLFNEYTKNGTPLCSIPFKIIRNGAKGDTQTKYTFIPLPADGMTLDQFPEAIDPRDAGIIKEYDFNTLQNYTATGSLPSNNANQGQPMMARPQPQAYGAPNAYQQPMQQMPMNGYQQAPMNNNRRTIMNNGNGGY